MHLLMQIYGLYGVSLLFSIVSLNEFIIVLNLKQFPNPTRVPALSVSWKHITIQENCTQQDLMNNMSVPL